MTTELESRVTALEKDTAVLEERTKNHSDVISEIKVNIEKIHTKLDAAIKRPSWAVASMITLLSSAVVGLLIYAVGK